MCISINFYGKIVIFKKKNVCGNKLPVIRRKKSFSFCPPGGDITPQSEPEWEVMRSEQSHQ